jgi:hypothetical protein
VIPAEGIDEREQGVYDHSHVAKGFRVKENALLGEDAQDDSDEMARFQTRQ